MSQGAIRTSLWPSSIKAAVALTNERRREHLTEIGRAASPTPELDDAIAANLTASEALRRSIRRTRDAKRAKQLWRDLANLTDRLLMLRHTREQQRTSNRS